MPARTSIDEKGRIGRLIRPRQLQYVNVQEGTPFPAIMHPSVLSSMAAAQDLYPTHDKLQRYREAPDGISSAHFFSITGDLGDMQADMLGSVKTPMAYDVSGVRVSRNKARDLEEQDMPMKPNFGGKRAKLETAAAIGEMLSQTEKLMGRQTGEYARRRAEQLEKFRGTPEPGLMPITSKGAANPRGLSKGSSMGTKGRFSQADSREDAILETFLQHHNSHQHNQPKQGWHTPVGDEGPSHPSPVVYSPPPGHLAFDPRSMSPLRDTVMPLSKGPVGWGADIAAPSTVHHLPGISKSPSLKPPDIPEKSSKERLLQGLDVEILPSDFRQSKPGNRIPRSNPIVQLQQEDAPAILLMPLPSSPAPNKAQSDSIFFHPHHKLPERKDKKVSLPSSFDRSSSNALRSQSLKHLSSSRQLTNSISMGAQSGHAVAASAGIVASRNDRSSTKAHAKDQKQEGGKKKEKHVPASKTKQSNYSKQGEHGKQGGLARQGSDRSSARQTREKLLGPGRSKTAEQVLLKLEDADERMEALREEIAAENARIRAERVHIPNPEMVQKNIDRCSQKIDKEARLAQKLHHFEECARATANGPVAKPLGLLEKQSDICLMQIHPYCGCMSRVRQRAKQMKQQMLEEKIYSTQRSDRLREAAAHRAFEQEQEDCVKTLAPILTLISNFSSLGDCIKAHRAQVKEKQIRLWAVITMQKVFRGYVARREYMKTVNAAKYLQQAWRIQFVWRIKLLRQKSATRVLQFIRDVHNQSDFIGAMKVAIHRIVKEKRKKSQMKTLSRGIMTTVLRGQWSKAEMAEIERRKEVTRIKKMRFMVALSAAMEAGALHVFKTLLSKPPHHVSLVHEVGLSSATHAFVTAGAPERGGGTTSDGDTSKVEKPAPPSQPAAAAAPAPAPLASKFGKGKLKGMVKKNMKKMRSLVGQSMPNASTVLDDLICIPDLVKLLVVEAFINLRAEQYVRVMGVYWLHKARYFRKRRAHERKMARMKELGGAAGGNQNSNNQPPLPPRLYPMPRGARANELKVMMQQGVYEMAIMEDQGGWDLAEKRVLQDGETSLLSEEEKGLIPGIQERLKKRMFMCNISVKANLMTPWKGASEDLGE